MFTYSFIAGLISPETTDCGSQATDEVAYATSAAARSVKGGFGLSQEGVATTCGRAGRSRICNEVGRSVHLMRATRTAAETDFLYGILDAPSWLTPSILAAGKERRHFYLLPRRPFSGRQKLL